MIRNVLSRAKYNQDKIDHERLNSLVNSMADGVLAVDEDTEIVLSNGAALNILDVNNSLRGRRLADVLRLHDKNNQPIDVERLVTKTHVPTSTRNLHITYPDGSIMYLYLSIAPVHLGYGRNGTHGFVLLMRDITHEKSLEDERDEFISVASHELRTPIAIAEGNIGNAQFIRENSGDPQQVDKALEQAHEQIVFLAGLVNDLSTLSRAEGGKLSVEIEPIDIRTLLAELVVNYLPDAKKKRLHFSVSATANVPQLISSKLYVREILQNFITNALKYTEKGSVSVRAEPIDKGVRFTVSDTGIGISKPDQEKIFDKFFRSEDYRTRKTNGTGLGLYVALKLSRLLHADINLESELNKGSTFTIDIPNLGK